MNTEYLPNSEHTFFSSTSNAGTSMFLPLQNSSADEVQVKTFRTLELAKEYYSISKDLKLSSHLRDQFLRCCSSVALNLSEGNAKRSEKEKLRFYEIAHGSFRESFTILELECINDEHVLEVGDRLGASLYKLTRAMSDRLSGPNY